MLDIDVATNGAVVGEPLELAIFEPSEIERPRTSAARRSTRSWWSAPTRPRSPTTSGSVPDPAHQRQRADEHRGGYQPYQPSPLITTSDTETVARPGRVDGARRHPRSPCPPTSPAADLDVAAAAATASRPTPTPRSRAAPDSATTSTTSCDVRDEVRVQQSTARASIAPAVLSLVLVALALLMRLLMAASEIRVPELALASLRGVSSRRLWVLGPVRAARGPAVATPLGVALGLGLARLLIRSWLVPDLPVPVPWPAGRPRRWCCWPRSRSPAWRSAWSSATSLASQLSGVRRPRGRPPLVGRGPADPGRAGPRRAVLSKLPASAQGDPDATDLVLPVLLAVVAGLAATRPTAWLATWWTRRSPGHPLARAASCPRAPSRAARRAPW